MDKLAFVMSLISLAISIVVAILESIRAYRISKTALEFELYKEVFKDHLIKLIPQARRCLCINKSMKLTGAKELLDELKQIRKDMLFFKYSNPEFYRSIKGTLQDLEDYLIDSTDITFSKETKKKFLSEVQSQLEDIYSIISKVYSGHYN